MKSSPTNIKFNYLYRDGGNYKNYGFVILANINSAIEVGQLESRIRKHLIDGEWFYANKVAIPSVRFSKWDDDLDHEWHEFESVELTDEPQTDERTIEQFLEVLHST